MQSINWNNFLSKLILGYYDTYTAEIQLMNDKVYALFGTRKISPSLKQQLTDSIIKEIFLPNVPVRKGKKPVHLSLKPTSATEGMITEIIQGLKDDYISQYFCRMLISYCQKPFSEREQVLFADHFRLLSTACQNRRPLSLSTIWNPQRIHEVVPYKLAIGREERFNYLLCGETNEETGLQEARSYRLNRLKMIRYNRHPLKLESHIISYLERMLENGPQYMINSDEEACVHMSDAGYRTYQRIYNGRPLHERVEQKKDGFYFFYRCSMDQLYLYFRKFDAGQAEVISPLSLRDRIISFHQESLLQYS